MRRSAAIIGIDPMSVFELLWRASGMDAPTSVIVDDLVDEHGHYSPAFPDGQPMGDRS